MIDMFIRCQANIFIDAVDIIPETSTMSEMLDLFKDDGFIPSTIHEMSGEGPKVRLRMGSPDNQWNILFLSQRIHIEQNCNPNQPIDSIDGFLVKAKIITKKIFDHLNRKSCRFSFIVDAILKKNTIEELQDSYNKLFIPLPTHKSNIPFEWNNRSISQKEMSFAGITEPVNILTEVKQLKVQLNLNDSVKASRRLLFQYELNTTADNRETRFSVEHFDSFLDIAYENYNTIEKELEDVLNA